MHVSRILFGSTSIDSRRWRNSAHEQTGQPSARCAPRLRRWQPVHQRDPHPIGDDPQMILRQHEIGIFIRLSPQSNISRTVTNKTKVWCGCPHSGETSPYFSTIRSTHQKSAPFSTSSKLTLTGANAKHFRQERQAATSKPPSECSFPLNVIKMVRSPRWVTM